MEPKMKGKFVSSSKVKIFENPFYKRNGKNKQNFSKKKAGCDDNGDPKSSTVNVVK